MRMAGTKDVDKGKGLSSQVKAFLEEVSRGGVGEDG